MSEEPKNRWHGKMEQLRVRDPRDPLAHPGEPLTRAEAKEQAVLNWSIFIRRHIEPHNRDGELSVGDVLSLNHEVAFDFIDTYCTGEFDGKSKTVLRTLLVKALANLEAFAEYDVQCAKRILFSKERWTERGYLKPSLKIFELARKTCETIAAQKPQKIK